MTLKTEEEARGCWCPFARFNSHVAERGDGELVLMTACNREPRHFVESNREDIPTMNCIASDCMAWQWGESAEEYVDMPGAVVSATRPRKNRKGYCGLAGQVSS